MARRTGPSRTGGGQRRAGLDILRGATLLSMTAYHACWDLVWIFGVDWRWYRSDAAFLWQQSICWTFILLSGYCFHLGRHPIRRGGVVFGCGALVTAVTVLFMPANRVWFGVLSLLGGAMLLTAPLDRCFWRIPSVAGLCGSFALFLFTRNASRGILGFGTWIRLPAALYRNDFTACLGFPPAGFFSTDYFPLLPWLFLFWTGWFLFPLAAPVRERSRRAGNGTVPYEPRTGSLPARVLAAMGRHSLLFYLLHQPVIYALLSAWDAIR